MEPPISQYEHVLSPLDQSVGRTYVRQIFTFPFPDVSEESVKKAEKCIRGGLKLTLSYYPFLAGKLGPDIESPKTNALKIEDGRAQEQADGQAQVEVGRKVEAERLSKVDSAIEGGTPQRDKKKAHRGRRGRVKQRNKKRVFQVLIVDILYDELRLAGMPVSRLPRETLCMAPAGNVTSKEFLPLFTLQANFCKPSGGLILCFAFQHSLVDGAAIAPFLKVLAENFHRAAALESPSLAGEKLALPPPYITPDTSPYYHTSEEVTAPQAHQETKASKIPSGEYSNIEIISRIFVLSAEQIRKLKGWVNMRFIGTGCCQPISQTDFVTALAWVLITRARAAPRHMTDLSRPTHLRTAVNVRHKLDPPLPDDFFGNMFIHATVESTYLDMRARFEDNSLTTIMIAIAQHAIKIRNAIKAIDDNSIRQRLGELAQLQDVRGDLDLVIPPFDRKNGVDFGSLASFGADINFGIPGVGGDGRAEYVRKVMPGKEGVANILPRRGGTQGDADWELCLSLREVEMDNMEKELAALGLLKRSVR